MKIRYSEIFFSMQGEAQYAGIPAVWLRFFGCNLNCSGFGQRNPTDPTTYELPYKDFDSSGITKIEQLPVWNKGCDSSYSWSSKFRHLAHEADVPTIVDRLIDANRSEHNPDGLFHHPKTGQVIMLCFTGGEPMLYQKAMMAILDELWNRNNAPVIVTVETNATQPLSAELSEHIIKDHYNWHFAMSPKLYTVSGERGVIFPEIIKSYANAHQASSLLKFVCNGTKENWNELEHWVNELHRVFKLTNEFVPPIWIMPVGATAEEQTPEFLGPICIEAMRRGYYVATRNQIAAFGNVIGS